MWSASSTANAQGADLALPGLGQVAADALRSPQAAYAPTLKNPTVVVVVDRVDLDTQISGTFYAVEMPNLVRTDTGAELIDLLTKDIRKVIIKDHLQVWRSARSTQRAKEHHRDGRRSTPDPGA